MGMYSPIELAWMAADYSKKEKKIRDGVVFDDYGVRRKTPGFIHGDIRRGFDLLFT